MGRLQSTKVAWDPRSGRYHTGSDSRRQTAHGVRAQPQLQTLREERKVQRWRTGKHRKKPEE